MSTPPIVSIVTPVHNGGLFLQECIESVLQQSYGAFECIIVDNASTDETRAIAESYAAKDGRIRVLSNPAKLSMLDNWNRAMEQVSDSSRYCKVLHADDLLYPQCLEKMVGLAERNPGIGIVGSLRLRGDRVECDGLPRDREVFSGREVARLFIRQEVFGFAPTACLIRSDLVRARRPFYPARYLHTDLAAYFDLLDQVDFGFIHEVQFFSREHAGSITTTVAEVRQTLIREWLFLLQDYGLRYFTRAELDELEEKHLRRWYRLLVRGAITGRGRDYLNFHLAGLREARRTPDARSLGRAMAAELADAILHPEKIYRHLQPVSRSASGRNPLKPGNIAFAFPPQPDSNGKA